MSKYWEKTKGFFRACNQVETLDALADAFVRYAEPLGVELVHAGVVWAADERSFLDAGFGTTDPEYGVIYRKERFIANDIIAQAAIKENLSFFWSEELAKRTLTKEEETVIQTAAEFHAKDGHTICETLDNVSLVISAIGDNIDVSEDSRSMLQMMSRFLAGRANYLSRQQRLDDVEDPYVELTPKHLAVMTHKSQGATNAQVAELLGASTKWVEKSTEEARDILRAKNTIQAVAMIATAGLLFASPRKN